MPADCASRFQGDSLDLVGPGAGEKAACGIRIVPTKEGSLGSSKEGDREAEIPRPSECHEYYLARQGVRARVTASTNHPDSVLPERELISDRSAS